ncbi:MAG: hypothetical protein WKF75_01795 [Singulisphaera sp.]
MLTAGGFYEGGDMDQANNYPKLRNAAWPGLVGKGPDSEPAIDLDTMIRLTAMRRWG